MAQTDPNKYKDWMGRWVTNITNDARNRYCDTAMGEDIGWLMQPFLSGFYYGYEVTHDPNWVRMLVDWTESWAKRKVLEPDGYYGWPMAGAAGTDVDKLNSYYADSLLGEAMVLTPISLMASEILKTPSLSRYEANARSYLALTRQMYAKWQSRGAFRDTPGGGAISVVLPYGIDSNYPNGGVWTANYVLRNDPNWGFSHPDNKANETAMWFLAMYDATGDANYRNRAQKWYTLMKSRMHPLSDGTYQIWNYWETASTWDYDPNGHRTKHWVGVHPNDGYYQIDTQSIVDAYQHGIVFTQADITRLVATDLANDRVWTALAPFDPNIQTAFEATFSPDGWGGLSSTPYYFWAQEHAVPEPVGLAILACGAAALLGRRGPRRCRRKAARRG
jgi:hypothetical protein